MRFSGLNKTTLLDYPGRVACTVFLGGCNFRCPYCQNKDLVLHPSEYEIYSEEDVLSHLKKRAGVLSGICITGGEPTLRPQLGAFIEQCKALGYAVKLDTNGTNPELLKELYKKNLIDYVAMDIKTGPSDYLKVAGLQRGMQETDSLSLLTTLDKIKESVRFLMFDTDPARLTYEFRTTVVRQLHDARSFEQIADWIAGARQYFLQSYEESEGVLQPGFSAYSKEELLGFALQIRDRVPAVQIRGVE